MPTLSNLLPPLNLRFLDTDDEREYRARSVSGIWPAAEVHLRHSIHDALVIAEDDQRLLDTPESADRFLRTLARGNAAALAVRHGAASTAMVGQHVLAAARRHRIPVLLQMAAMPWGRMAQLVGDLRCREAAAEAERLRRLLRTVRETGPQSTDELIRWLASAVDGIVEVTRPYAPLPQVDGLTIPQSMVRALRDGSLETASVDSEPWRVRLYAMGSVAPHSVLVVARRDTFSPDASRAVAEVMPLLAWSVRLPLAEADARATVSVAVLQLLMGRQVPLAQRTAHALRLCAPTMTADRVRVYLLACAPGLRDTAAATCVHALESRALIVRCPVDDGQVIVIAPASDASEHDDAGAALRALVRDVPGYHLGISRPTELLMTAPAYEEATRSLAVARNSADRIAEYQQQPDLALLLDPTANEWAERFLRPLHELSPTRRADTVHSVRLGLAFGVGGAAQLSGLHRNTVRARLTRASSLLGVDLRRLRDRAVVDLALRVQDRPTTVRPRVGDLSLNGLLKSPPAREWAAEFLAPLDTDRHRDLRRTLTTWVAYDAHTETAATKLDLHYKTVLAHLIAAEQLLQRPLLESHRQVTDGEESTNGRTGAHDVALALHIVASRLTVLSPHLLA
jgi:arsenate reductase-like glutaredoxin family protein